MHYNRETNARVRCEVDSYVIVHEHLAFDGFRFVGDDLAVANALEFLRGALTNLFPVSLTPGASVLALVFTIIDQHDASVDDHGWLIRIVHVFDARGDEDAEGDAAAEAPAEEAAAEAPAEEAPAEDGEASSEE